MNKISLIIPDLHHRWHQAEKIISSVGADEVIFLGDYFDDFDDTAEMVSDTCEWLKDSVNKPNRIHLFGNHDVGYAFSYATFKCSGYEQWKKFITQDMLTNKTWDKLQWYHVLDNRWLLTHAGLHKLNVPNPVLALSNDREKFLKAITDHLDVSIIEGFKAAANNVPHWIFNAGRARWGQQRVGGITWCDYEREFLPVAGLNQIVGHTPQQNGVKWTTLTKNSKVKTIPLAEYSPTSQELDDTNLTSNICLDVHGNTHYATWDGKKLVVGNYRDL